MIRMLQSDFNSRIKLGARSLVVTTPTSEAMLPL